jgi:hypothetical protein
VHGVFSLLRCFAALVGNTALTPRRARTSATPQQKPEIFGCILASRILSTIQAPSFDIRNNNNKNNKATTVVTMIVMMTTMTAIKIMVTDPELSSEQHML